MVLDKGLGPGELKDLLVTAADYIDFIKLGFGTTALYRGTLLEEKITLAKSFGVDIYPGGTFLRLPYSRTSFWNTSTLPGGLASTPLKFLKAPLKCPRR